MNEDKVYFQGTRDSPLNKKDSSYVVYEVHKCSEKTMKPGYPSCASPEEIEDFIREKFIAFKVLNEKIDFT